jgi:hypothetical protein
MVDKNKKRAYSLKLKRLWEKSLFTTIQYQDLPFLEALLKLDYPRVN